MRRVAWFCVVVDSENEEVVNKWLTTVNTAVDKFARQAADICGDELSVLEVESGQSIPIRDPNV